MICQPHVLRATPRPVPLRSHCATLRAQWNRALSSAYPSSQAFGLPRGEGFVFVQRFLDRLLCRTAWTPAHGEGGHCEPRAKQSRDSLAAPLDCFGAHAPRKDASGFLAASLRRGEIHSSLGGTKAHLKCELKDLRPPQARAKGCVLDFVFQMGSGSAAR